jgi:thiol-disulfide isomerase/thioredoxin
MFKKYFKNIIYFFIAIFILSNIVSFIKTTQVRVDTTTFFNSQDIDIVYFWTDWCRVCKIQKPMIKALEDRLNIISIEVYSQQNRSLADKFNIKVFPTICYIGSDKVSRYCESGYTSSWSIYLKSFLLSSI